jgi:hypothetical protein
VKVQSSTIAVFRQSKTPATISRHRIAIEQQAPADRRASRMRPSLQTPEECHPHVIQRLYPVAGAGWVIPKSRATVDYYGALFETAESCSIFGKLWLCPQTKQQCKGAGWISCNILKIQHWPHNGLIFQELHSTKHTRWNGYHRSYSR